MLKRAEMLAEELVFEVAEELGMRETDVRRLDALSVAHAALRRLRIDLKKQAGWALTLHDYRLPNSRPVTAVGPGRYVGDAVES
jgi:hypothetical protein